MRELEVKPTVTTENGKRLEVNAMVDSGCTHTCIGEKVVEEEGIPTVKLPKPMKAKNADGSPSGNKPIKRIAASRLGEYSEPLGR